MPQREEGGRTAFGIAQPPGDVLRGDVLRVDKGDELRERKRLEAIIERGLGAFGRIALPPVRAAERPNDLRGGPAFRALDADNGKVLWETVLPGSIANSTITYSVNNKQYVAVLTGRGAVTGGVITQAGITPPPANTNGVYVFALP